MSQNATNRYTRLQTLLQHQFHPLFMELVDESFKHQVPKDAESHFKLTLVSQKFTGKNRIERHRLLNESVNSERQTGLHALSLALYSPEEWDRQPHTLQTPACQHKES